MTINELRKAVQAAEFSLLVDAKPLTKETSVRDFCRGNRAKMKHVREVFRVLFPLLRSSKEKPMSRVLNVRLSHSGRVLAEGSLAITDDGNSELALQSFINRLSQYSGSHYIGGVHADLSIAEAPAKPAEITPPPATEVSTVKSPEKAPRAPSRPAAKSQPKASKKAAKAKKPAKKTAKSKR